MTEQEVMDAKEVAKYLGVHLVSVYRLIKAGNIPMNKIGGLWRVRKSILDAWIDGKMND